MELEHFISSCKMVDPDVVVLFNPSDSMVDIFLEEFYHKSIVVATSRRPSSRVLMAQNAVYRRISDIPSPGIGTLVRVKTFFSAAMGEGILKTGQRVACCFMGDLSLFMEVNTSKLGIPSLSDVVGDGADVQVLEVVMELASEIAREGKEGHPIGSLFIVGDEQKVFMHSVERVKNPFRSTDGRPLSIVSTEDAKTIKEYAFIDGAVVLDGKGRAVSAGRYVLIQDMASLHFEEGQGGRHMAAAYITHVTRAVAVVVSSTKVIRVFKDGRVIFEVKNV